MGFFLFFGRGVACVAVGAAAFGAPCSHPLRAVGRLRADAGREGEDHPEGAADAHRCVEVPRVFLGISLPLS